MLPVWTDGGDPVAVRHLVLMRPLSAMRTPRTGMEPGAFVAVLQDFLHSRCDGGIAHIASVMSHASPCASQQRNLMCSSRCKDRPYTLYSEQFRQNSKNKHIIFC